MARSKPRTPAKPSVASRPKPVPSPTQVRRLVFVGAALVGWIVFLLVMALRY